MNQKRGTSHDSKQNDNLLVMHTELNFLKEKQLYIGDASLDFSLMNALTIN